MLQQPELQRKRTPAYSRRNLLHSIHAEPDSKGTQMQRSAHTEFFSTQSMEAQSSLASNFKHEPKLSPTFAISYTNI